MAKIPTAIDFEQVEDRKSFDVIPPQDVVAAIVGSEYKQNKKQNGYSLNFEVQILEGEFQGRKLWPLLNIDNPSADAVRIAQAELKEILVATDMLGKFGDDTEVLHNIPFIATLKVVPPVYEKDAQGNVTTTVKYKAKNEIAKYSPCVAGYQAPPQPANTAAHPAQQPNAAAAKAGLPPFLANKKQG